MALDPATRKWLESRFRSSVRFNELMSKHTHFRVGGPADAYVAPESIEDLVPLVSRLNKQGIPYRVIGDGTNLLVKDGGIRGIVIVLTKCLNKIVQADAEGDDVVVNAMAGARMRMLCDFSIARGFEGMNFALGIPGTVGGAIMMNAGTSHGSMESVLDAIRVLTPEGQIENIGKEKLNFGYRELSWGNEKNESDQIPAIILEGRFCLRLSDPEKLKKEAEAILRKRRKTQPIDFPSAGCFFKNPLSGKTAGELIELAGLKGRKIGGAEISTKHANFIINQGNASSADILALMELVQEAVSKAFGVKLETEVNIVGE
jgi:UDP-N-acetylmuramate dehydrogenase